MKETVKSIVTVTRKNILLLGLLIGVAAFGVVAFKAAAQKSDKEDSVKAQRVSTDKVEPVDPNNGEVSTIEMPESMLEGIDRSAKAAGPRSLDAPNGVGFQNEVEPNGTFGTATAITTPGAARGNVFANGDIDYYSFTASAGDRVYAAVMTSGSSNASSDSVLRLYASDGTTELELDDNDGSLGASSSSIAGRTIPSAGTYFLRVNNSSAVTQLRPYDLHVRVQTGAPTAEVEGNDTPATANVLPGSGWVSGVRNPAAAAEQDWFSFTAAAGDTVYLGLDLDPERDNVQWDGRLGIALFGDANNQILVVNDASVGSVANPLSEAMFMTIKTAGTYYAFVDSSSAAVGGPTATYNLSVTVFPKVNEGVNCTTYTSTNVPQTIPTGPGIVSSTITVPGNPRIADLDVNIQLNHNFMNDLDVTLRSPAGNDNGIFSDIGSVTAGSQTQMDVTFDDEAGIPPAFTIMRPMIWQPELNYRLNWFDGEDAGGVWTLDIRDDATGDGGTLTAWSMTICEQPASAGTSVYSENFDGGGGTDGLFTHSGAGDEWERGNPTAAPVTGCNSGTNCWKTDLDNTYNASSNQTLLSPNINLTSVTGPITLEWAMKYQLEPAQFDGASVVVQQVGNPASARTVWQFLAADMVNTVGNPGVTIQESAGWGRYRADISSFAGQNVELLFNVYSDASVQRGGLAIDDVSVRAAPAGPATTAGQLVISEFRVRGPSGANDEFIEVYNTTGAPLTAQSADASSGLAVVASDGTARCVIPNGTVIPAGGHYMCTNSAAYSLGGSATGDATHTTDIPDNSGLAIFNSSTPANFILANRLDAVGMTSSAALYKEGAGLPTLTPFSIDYSFVRKLPGVCTITGTAGCSSGGTGRPGLVDEPGLADESEAPVTSSEPQDTDDNVADFYFVDTNGTSAGAGQRLGAPGPENLASPGILDGAANLALFDTCAGQASPPNQVRDFTSDPANNSTFGTLDFRRTFTNTSAAPITRLRFRVVEVTTFPAPSGFADLRPRTSGNLVVTADRPPCGAGTSNLTVNGTTLEQPPSQLNGGGFNSSWAVPSVSGGSPLAAGAAIDLRFLTGIQQTGTFQVCVVAETIPVTQSSVECFSPQGVATTTVVASTQNPSVFGQSVTFNATVSPNPGAGAPVNFVIDGGAPIATVTNASGVASTSTAALTVATHTVVANFTGSPGFIASSGTLTPVQTVNAASTTTTITADTPDPSVTGQAVAVNFTVAPVAPGAGSPAGNVTITAAGGAETCTATVAAGTCNITLTAAGSRALTATFVSGNGNFTGSASTPATPHTVNPPDIFYAVTNGNVLLHVDKNIPSAVTTIGPVTGLGAGENIVGIDVRPANGALYAMGLIDDGATRTGRIYTINPTTAAATAVGPAFSATLADTDFWGFNFNPRVDRIRITNRSQQNLRVNPDTGALAATDTNLSTTGINGVSYDRPLSGATTTTLYAINFDLDTFGTIGGINGTPSPNGGTYTPIGSTGIVGLDAYHLDIESVTEVARATANGNLYTVNLGTGAFTLVGGIAGSPILRGITHPQAPFTATTTTITSSANPSVVGQSVTFTATVATTPVGGTPTGTVQFFDGASPLGAPVALSGLVSQAQVTTSALTLGNHTITAQYTSNNAAFPNSSGSMTGNPQVVTLGATTTTVTAAPASPSTFGQSVTFTATVAAVAPAVGPPTGTVSFNIDGNIYCANTPLNGSGVATCTQAGLPALPAGLRNVVALYSGNASLSTSAGTLNYTVNKAVTAIAITGDTPDPSVIGQPYAVTWAITITAPGAGAPTGNVTVSDGTATCTAPASAGTCNLTSTTSGNKTLVATYAGDANFLGSVSAGVPHVVNQSISGTVRNGITLAPASGVQMVLLCATPATTTTTTNAAGQFTFTGQFTGPCELFPNLSFTEPFSRFFTPTGNITGADFLVYANAGEFPRKISFPTQYVAPGVAGVMPVIMQSQDNEASVAFTFTYDTNPFSQPPVVTCGANAPGCTVVNNTSIFGRVGFTVTPAAGGFSRPDGTPLEGPEAAGPKEIAKINFISVATNLPSTDFGLSQNTPVAFSIIEKVTNNPLTAVFITPARVVFAQGREGDVAGRNTGNGAYEAADVVQTRRFVAGIDTPVSTHNEYQRADTAPAATKGDGTLNATDVIQTRRYAATLDAGQTAGGPGVAAPAPIAPPELNRAAAESEITVGDANATNSTRISVPVTMKANGTELATSFTVRYDETRLGNPNVTLGDGAPDGAVLTFGKAEPGYIRILIDSSRAFAATKDAHLVDITFDVLETAPSGAARVEIDELVFADADARETRSKATNGTITIAGPVADDDVTTPLSRVRKPTVEMIEEWLEPNIAILRPREPGEQQRTRTFIKRLER